jgi:hypothetical protein
VFSPSLRSGRRARRALCSRRGGSTDSLVPPGGPSAPSGRSTGAVSSRRSSPRWRRTLGARAGERADVTGLLRGHGMLPGRGRRSGLGGALRAAPPCAGRAAPVYAACAAAGASREDGVLRGRDAGPREVQNPQSLPRPHRVPLGPGAALTPSRRRDRAAGRSAVGPVGRGAVSEGPADARRPTEGQHPPSPRAAGRRR